MFLLHRPSPRTIERFIDASRDLSLSYGPTGILGSARWRGNRDNAVVVIGRGQADFERARAALKAWKGTLTNHAESGEELFEVSLNPVSGDVAYSISAVSRPRATLARLGHPIVRLLQARFRGDSAAAMTRTIRGDGAQR